jgi:hypothetical protein
MSTTEQELAKRWIVERRPGTAVDLRTLAPGQCAAWGDGATYHLVLTPRATTPEGGTDDG